MKLKLNLGIIFLILLSSCSNINIANKTIASASEQVEIKQGQILPITAAVKVKGEIIELEVAQTPKQQALGLMFRKSLADNRGMLFPFQNQRVARFWMKNVFIPLDMIFLNGDRVVGIEKNVPGCKSDPCPVYGPKALVDRVIELRGGRAEELGIKLNDKILIEPY